jgi:uncharacterized damage-inducible protein DinB
MSISQSLLPEFDQETANTRKTLERVPGDKLDYKPHEKSMTMGRLAQHISEMPGWGATTLSSEEFDISPDGSQYQPPPVGTPAEILAAFDKGVAALRSALAATPDDVLMKPWSLKMAGKTMFTMPRVAVIRGMIMNHIIHHRAQLGVYLRMNNIPVPAIYGPSADEGAMGAAS